MLWNRRLASSRGQKSFPVLIEGLEERRLLSASIGQGLGSVIGGLIGGFLSGGDFHFHHDQFVAGTVVSVDTSADTITISNPSSGNSSPSTYTLASTATLMADGSTITLGSLMAGANVELQLSTDASTNTTTVTSLTALPQSASGVVSSVDTTANTLTLTGFNGGSTTYTIGSSATIMLDGSTSTLGALVSGDQVVLTLSALDGKTVTQVNARDGGLFGHGVNHHMTATVVSTDTTADTITVSTTSNGSTVQTTYTVDPSATITADGATTTLAMLLAGAQVQLTVSSSSATTVTAIAAVSQNVSGTVSSVDATAGTIAITSHGGTATTYTVGSSATITINGTTGTLAGITAGSQANLTLSAFDGKTVTSISAHTPVIIGHFIPINATVVSIDTTGDTITASTTVHGTTTQTTYTIDPSATITADGTATPLSSVSAGAHVLLTLSSTSATTVTSIAAISQIVTGTVSSFDTTADTITITAHDGTSSTYPVSSTATITINGATGMLSGISDGSRVSLKLSALDGKTVTTIWVGAPNLNNNNNSQSEDMLATVVSVDSSGDTITVSVVKDGSTTQVTYSVSSTATITADGASTTLGDLLPGARVLLHLSIGTTTTVTSIQAMSQSVAGTVSSVDTTGDTITITPGGSSTTTTYTLSSTATITLNGASSTLTALAAGTRVHLTLSAFDGATVTAITGTTPGTIVHHRRAVGTVTAVDTTGNTITITSPFAGSTPATYTLATTATITAAGSATTLANLLPGAEVVLQLTTIGTTTTVTSINAITQHASGTVSSVDTTNNTITITTRGGTQTFTLGTGATITLNGATGTLASLVAGVRVQLTLSALDGKTVTAIRAHGS